MIKLLATAALGLASPLRLPLSGREDGHARGSAYDLRRLPLHGKGEPPGRAGRNQRRGVGRGQDGGGDFRR
jgi:hypothetical protein